MTPIRAHWTSEPEHFTPAVVRQIEDVRKAAGLPRPLNVVGREWRNRLGIVDIVADDGADDLTVIENQFGWADGDHLGRLIVYAEELKARHAILIAEHFHTQVLAAIGGLNAAFGEQRTFHALTVAMSDTGPTFGVPDSHAHSVDAVIAPREIAAFWRAWMAGGGSESTVEAGGGRLIATEAPGVQIRLWIDRHGLHIGLIGKTPAAADRIKQRLQALAEHLALPRGTDPGDHWLPGITGDDGHAARAALTDWLPRYRAAAEQILTTDS